MSGEASVSEPDSSLFETGSGRSVGHPAFAPSLAQRDRVSSLAACGVRHDLIVTQILNPETGRAIDTKTLRKAFRKELTNAMTDATARVANALFDKAVSGGEGSVGAMIFWLKNRDPVNWKDRQDLQHGGKVTHMVGVLQLPDGSADAEV